MELDMLRLSRMRNSGCSCTFGRCNSETCDCYAMGLPCIEGNCGCTRCMNPYKRLGCGEEDEDDDNDESFCADDFCMEDDNDENESMLQPPQKKKKKKGKGKGKKKQAAKKDVKKTKKPKKEKLVWVTQNE